MMGWAGLCHGRLPPRGGGTNCFEVRREDGKHSPGHVTACASQSPMANASGHCQDGRRAARTRAPLRPPDRAVSATARPRCPPDIPEIRSDFAHYYDAMETMDGHVATKLAELEAAGLADDTIVFFYSDNGGVLPRSKRHCYDEGLRTALIVRFPEKWAHLAPRPAGSLERRAVTSVDYGPTVLALAGVDTPAHMQGRPFAGVRHLPAARYAFGGRDRMDERPPSAGVCEGVG
ncbi:sulfatase-like hydrolase/transferase [Streptomyces sp. NPDC051956]|uniref:sulfatase-like hydrolase/transferase n=1 Tax=Streptomyces sp. NPDC051956 TaxID=3365677 RepID=UPI0037CCFBC4